MAFETRLTLAGYHATRGSREVREALEQIANRIVAAADAAAGTPGGHLALPGESRRLDSRFAVITRSAAAVRSEARNRTLTRSFQAGRVGK